MQACPLWTDLYELTMMGGFFRSGVAERRAVFDLFFRRIPHDGGYAVVAGLQDALRFLSDLHFEPDELEYLSELGLFPPGFVDRLADFRFTGDVYALPEGTPAFAYEPLLRLEGTLLEAQLVESALLNLINFSTLIASKAARVVQEAGYDKVVEFGLRRAQGPDGSFSATRAAYIGGVAATSNTFAGARLNIPVRGTHAHSWVMAFPDELSAFRAYAESYPDSCILLVDTYDTLGSGVPNAITVGRELRARGHDLYGIRLDSGDLAYLSIEARRMLDAAGFTSTRIVASGDLDEWIIHDLLSQGARIDVWGVGTRLVTGGHDSALGGVYKLAAVERNGHLLPAMKVSDNPAKETLPAKKQVWRLFDGNGTMMADVIALADEELPERDGCVLGYNPHHEYQRKDYAY
ncbi:nicotinate phosphoribosyltransferase, partial [bacterium]|nr:nicotinate phosphoribosyltransferase [bacterium]